MENLHYCEGLEATLYEALHPRSEEGSVIQNKTAHTSTRLSLTDRRLKTGVLFAGFDGLGLWFRYVCKKSS